MEVVFRAGDIRSTVNDSIVSWRESVGVTQQAERSFSTQCFTIVSVIVGVDEDDVGDLLPDKMPPSPLQVYRFEP